MIPRPGKKYQRTTTFVLLENKKVGVDSGKYQIPGELLAVGYSNYFSGDNHAQTVFAVRIVGMLNTRVWLAF